MSTRAHPDDPAAPTAPHPRSGRGATNTRLRTWIIALIAVIGLLLILLMIWAIGWRPLSNSGAAVAPTRELIMGGDDSASVLGANPEAESSIPPPGSPPGLPPAVGPRFQSFYEQRGGLRVLGNPLAPPTVVNGREIQWFERARLEHWPEHAGTPYEIQLGRLGAEYTAGRDFSKQTYFASRPDLRYFPETEHAVGGAFLAFYDRYGGLDTFGYPISEEFDEVLPDGVTYRVQYFERARFEYHPALAGTENEVQLGLLGRALYLNEERPSTIQPAPSALPMP